MRGFVATPDWVVDRMIEALFRDMEVTEETRILDPGCGPGALTAGVLRYCERNGLPVPLIDAVELDPARASMAEKRLSHPRVRVHCLDFLAATHPFDEYDLAVGNPPYVAITGMEEDEKQDFRERFVTARGRFDLYFLFFERSLDLLRPDGRLVFITPEKFLKVWSARPLRLLLDRHWVESIEFFPEGTFDGYTTYPVVTSVRKLEGSAATHVVLRGDIAAHDVVLPSGGAPWTSALRGEEVVNGEATLADVTTRVSCGVATGADAVFLLPADDVPDPLRPFAHPTISGRQLARTGGLTVTETDTVLLSPYDRSGTLRPESDLEPLLNYLADPPNKERLENRTCVTRERSPRPWFAFHETPPAECLQPKILFRDLTDKPRFWIDEAGSILPRHSVYYMIPAPGIEIRELTDYLNSEDVAAWLRVHSQRAANGFLRLQSRVMRRLPVPQELSPTEVSSP